MNAISRNTRPLHASTGPDSLKTSSPGDILWALPSQGELPVSSLCLRFNTGKFLITTRVPCYSHVYLLLKTPDTLAAGTPSYSYLPNRRCCSASHATGILVSVYRRGRYMDDQKNKRHLLLPGKTTIRTCVKEARVKMKSRRCTTVFFRKRND